MWILPLLRLSMTSHATRHKTPQFTSRLRGSTPVLSNARHKGSLQLRTTQGVVNNRRGRHHQGQLYNSNPPDLPSALGAPTVPFLRSFTPTRPPFRSELHYFVIGPGGQIYDPGSRVLRGRLEIWRVRPRHGPTTRQGTRTKRGDQPLHRHLQCSHRAMAKAEKARSAKGNLTCEEYPTWHDSPSMQEHAAH